jgi:hypothetical protein
MEKFTCTEGSAPHVYCIILPFLSFRQKAEEQRRLRSNGGGSSTVLLAGLGAI